MDFHTKLLLTLTLFSMLVLIGGIIFHLIEMNDKFNTLVTANIALDGQLNNQIQVNRQLLLERDLSAVQIIMRADEVEPVPMPHWLDTLPKRPETFN